MQKKKAQHELERQLKELDNFLSFCYHHSHELIVSLNIDKIRKKKNSKRKAILLTKSKIKRQYQQ